MDLSYLYHEIKNRIEKVDFTTLWKGFQPFKFALYTDKECCFEGEYIEKTDIFCANTAIQFQDEYIAIWNVEQEPEDMDCLAASIIHEMFHAFQIVPGESRFADEKEALLKYRYLADNLCVRRREADYIRAILEQDDKSAYGKLLELRKMRAEHYPYEYRYEANIEQIEGSAKFVEVSALAQLAPWKGKQEWQKILERISREENYFPARILPYDTGAAVIACIKKCTVMDCETFTDQPFACEMIADVAGCNVSVPENAEMKVCLDRYLTQTHEIIERAVKKNDCVLKGKFPLASVNIGDARREENYLTSNFFLMYRDNGELRTIRGNFVIEVDKDYNVLTVWNQ